MGFAARFAETGTKPPIKGYISATGLNHYLLRQDEGSARATLHARTYTVDIVKKNSTLFLPAQYIIAGIWAEDIPNIKIIEFFGFGNIHKWQEDTSEVYSWIFHNGIYQPDERNIACGDMIRILAMEEMVRKGSKNIEEFLDMRIFLGDLQPFFEI